MLFLIVLAIGLLNGSVNAMEQQKNNTIQNFDYSADHHQFLCSQPTNILYIKSSLWFVFLVSNAAVFSGFTDLYNGDIGLGLRKGGIGATGVLLNSVALWLMNRL